MKIIASSVLEKADSFLHAGYISAYARPLDSMRTPYSPYSAYWTSSGDAGAGRAPGPPQLTLDVAEALRLEGETLTHEAAVAPPPRSAGTIGVAIHPDPNAVLATQWTEWNIPMGDFTGVNAAGVKTMYIGLGNRNAPVPGGAGLITVDDIRLTKPQSDDGQE